jgi:hypothetical protein
MRTRPVLAILLLTVALGVAHATDPAPSSGLGELHTFNDWVVGCDNVRTCEAHGYGTLHDDPAVGRAALLVRRDAGPGRTPVVKIRYASLDDPSGTPASGEVVTLQAGALRIRLEPVDAEGESPVPPGQVSPVLGAVQRGDELWLVAGTQRWSVSLAGAAAALLKMDDLQGRVGTVGALMRRGGRLDPPAPALPHIERARVPPTTPADLALGGAILAEFAADCADIDADVGRVGIARVTSRSLLVAQPCSPGAYQTGARLWLVDDHAPFHPRPVPLPEPDGGTYDLLILEMMNQEAGTLRLHESAKSRGIGDCCSTREWTWTTTGLALVEAAESPCELFEAGGLPITLWRTR